MIDIHTHALPDIDDGAKNEIESVTLLQADFTQGVKEIVFTPHFDARKQPLQEFLSKRQAAFDKIAADIPKGLKTRLGAEVCLTGLNDPSNETLCSLAIDGTNCVLIELPFLRRWNYNLFVRLGEFISDTGYLPMIAHIERYDEALKNPMVVSELVEMGCLIQLNTGAFLQKHTKRFAELLLSHGLVHALGTDMHNTEKRAPDYEQAKAYVEKRGLSDAWEQVQQRMQNTLNKRPTDTDYTPLKKVLWRYI